MKSKPGALKRKQKMDNQERERFAKNMAQLIGAKTDGETVQTAPATSKWAALRGFIGQTLENRPGVQVRTG